MLPVERLLGTVLYIVFAIDRYSFTAAFPGQPQDHIVGPHNLGRRSVHGNVWANSYFTVTQL